MSLALSFPMIISLLLSFLPSHTYPLVVLFPLSIFKHCTIQAYRNKKGRLHVKNEPS